MEKSSVRSGSASSYLMYSFVSYVKSIAGYNTDPNPSNNISTRRTTGQIGNKNTNDNKDREDKKSDTSSFSIIESQTDQLLSIGSENNPNSHLLESPTSSIASSLREDSNSLYSLPENATLAQYIWYYYCHSKHQVIHTLSSYPTRLFLSIIIIPFISGFAAALTQHYRANSFELRRILRNIPSLYKNAAR